MVIKEHLPASSARGDKTAPPVASRCNREQLFRPCACRNAQGDQFGARAAAEVVDVHCLMDVPVNIHRGRGDGVVDAIPEGSR
ncbi:hypothetical protein [Arthrobacter sp. B2I5]|uniref:hypothetical protein n=1 Tax=Arthrobacter sp. B2I5 TaxID=3042266 RepID=UPI0027D78721|nr:hypothetical protein [Arthrobacter sp. B2I5]